MAKKLKKLEKDNPYKGYGLLRLFISALRSPYERVFAHQNKRVRYRGVAKNQFAEFMKAICFNLKRLAVLDPPNLLLN